MSFECHAADEQDDENHVGEHRREVHHLAALDIISRQHQELSRASSKHWRQYENTVLLSKARRPEPTLADDGSIAMQHPDLGLPLKPVDDDARASQCSIENAFRYLLLTPLMSAAHTMIQASSRHSTSCHFTPPRFSMLEITWRGAPEVRL